jgi:hypothetical protein
MKNLCMLALSLLLLAGCGNNEEVLPYEVPLVSCVEANLPATVAVDNLTNELGIIKQVGSPDYPSFNIVVEGNLFTKDKTYGACNLPTSLEKNGQRIRFDAIRMRNNDPRVNSIPLLSLTSIKLVK